MSSLAARAIRWVGFALAAGIVLLTASAQRDPAGHYVDAVPGKPLCTLRIHVTGFRNGKGKAGGIIFASPAGWPEDRSKAVASGGFDIHDRQVTEEFEMPPGRYGVAVIHDENENQKLDRNFLGIPKEGFGFANNPRVLLSAPSFQAASTQVACPVTQIQIRLIYK
ncbi:MAG: DUF2141 domain-containing protein [Acidobacteriaceae bacterium]